MKEHDRDKFIEAVGKELDGHEKMGNYEPIPISDLPKGTKLIDMVWSMRCKRRINTQEVYKWKARLNVHGGQQEHGVHYWDTYAPVVTWQTVHQFLILSLLLGVAKSSTRFRHGIPASASGDAALHAITPGIPALWNDEEDTSTETHMQRVWAETGRPCLE